MTTTKTAQFRTDTGLPAFGVARPARSLMQLNLMAKASTSQQCDSLVPDSPGALALGVGEGGRSSTPASQPPALSGTAGSWRGPFVVFAKPKSSDVTTTSEKVRHDQANDHQRERVRRDPRSDS